MNAKNSLAVPKGYKQTEVGVIPEDWEGKCLNEICEFSSSKRIFENDYVKDGIPFYRGQEITRLLENKELSEIVYISPQKYDAIKAKYGVPINGDILITAVGTLGNSYLVRNEKPFYFKDGNLIWLRNFSGVSQEYLIKQLYFNKMRVLASAIGSSQKALTMISLAPLKFSFPPTVKEQTTIANALSDVDALIAELEKLIAKKQAIKTATMQQLLTGRTRLPAFALRPDGKKKGYKSSELGEIPEDWEVVAFNRLAYPSSSRVNPKAESEGCYCIELEHIDQGSGQLIGHTETTMDSSLKSIFQEGDVLFGKLRAYLKKYWYADQHGVCSTEIWVLRANANCAYSKFIFYVIQTDRFIEAATEAYGTHMPRADWKVVGNLPIGTPPLPEQTAIANILSDMDEEIQALQGRLAKTRQIKQGMMQELLTGRTRLV